MHIRLYYTWCILFVILLLPLFLSQSVELATPTYTIISIVDITGLLSCLIKVHSVLKSTKSSTQFGFKFLVLDTANSKGETLQLEKWNEIFQYAFPDVQFESKLWRTPATMPKLRQKDFEKDYIFSRFYLADIFPAVDQYVYLDNDLVVTADLVELFQTPLAVSAFMATSGAPTKPGLLAALPADSTSTHPRSNRPGGTNAVLNQRDQFKTQAYMEEKKRMAQIKEDLKRKPPPGGGFKPCVGFVYERHTDYNRYLEDNFNRSHPKVVETQGLMLSSLFLNGGVALVNASCWRQRKMRQQAEALMVLNTEPGNQMYGTGAGTSHVCFVQLHFAIYFVIWVLSLSRCVGDQAVFYLLLQNRVAYLHARWNMRRLPMKTVHMLSHRQLTGRKEGRVVWCGVVLYVGLVFIICMVLVLVL